MIRRSRGLSPHCQVVVLVAASALSGACFEKTDPCPERTAFEAAAWRPHATAMTPTEKNVGLILVDVDQRTGAVVGPHTLRSGSYNRASGGWGG